MKNNLILLLIAVFVFSIDQATKLMVAQSMLTGQIIELTSFFNLVHWRNSGIAFGLMPGSAWDYIILFITLLGMIALAVWVVRFGPKALYGRIGLAVALGGAAGNFLDRIIRGEEVDFLDFHIMNLHWPAFNVADSAITTGFGLLIYAWIRKAEL